MTEVGGKMEAIVALAKRRGFVYQGSEIYGGLAGTWDYGPLGVALKKNIENCWWKMFVEEREDMYGVDAAILMNPKAREGPGPASGFSDPMVECQNKKCKDRRHRVDHLLSASMYSKVLSRLKSPERINTLVSKTSKEITDSLPAGIEESFQGEGEYLTRKEIDEKIKEFEKKRGVIVQASLLENQIKCPSCGQIEWGVPRQFNMMLKTSVGATEDVGGTTYLRPETAGGMFVNYKNVIDSLHPKLPFGLAQIGKAFRNEIAPRDFIFRVREFEQMEVEYFVRPEEWEKYFEEWRLTMWKFIEAIGISKDRVHELEVGDSDRAHYSKHTIDFEYDYPFGRKELYGLAYRTDFDLKSHQEGSTVDLTYFDEEKKERFLPHVIEPSLGVGRTMLALLLEAYTEDEMGGEKRVYLKLKPEMAPVCVAIFPLLKNKPELVAKAREVFLPLKKQFGNVMFDDNGNIGKRYRRQDEIGTPYCVTVDFDTLGEKPELKDTVTLRDRDTGKQERIALSELSGRVSRIV